MLECICINSDADSGDCVLEIDGKAFDDPSHRAHLTKDGKIGIYDADESLYKALVSISLEQLILRIWEISLLVDFSLISDEGKLGFGVFHLGVNPEENNQLKISVSAEFKPSLWNYPWPMWKHSEAFENYLNSKKIEFNTHEMEMGELNGVYPAVKSFSIYSLEDSSQYKTLAQAVEEKIAIFQDAFDFVVEHLKREEGKESIYRKFAFPKQVAIPCQQYLMYFTQFLGDLGLDATASIANEAGEILFAVTPEDQSEALEKIKLALEVFLRLPAAPAAISLGSTAYQDIELQQLTANIQHLQSQLMLANATIQQQSLTIQQQTSTLQNALHGTGQTRPFSGEIIIESMTVDTDKKDPGEPMLGGLVSVKKGKFLSESVEIDLPKLIRMLKKFLNDL